MTLINAARLRAGLVGPYAAVDVVSSTGSTNADLRAAAVDGAPDRTVLIAEEQTAGVGRRGREWISPKDSALCLSVLLRPQGVAFADLGSLAIVAGLAVLDLARELGVDAALKWPNDVLAGPDRGKCAGILAEAVAAEEVAVVLGIGLNVRPLGPGVRPGAGGLRPTSLAENGARTTDRTEVAELLLTAFAAREGRWREAGGDLGHAGMLDEYRKACDTLGQQVRVMLPGDAGLLGTATDVDPAGQLIVEDEQGKRHLVFAGDVVHLRAVP
ncbi:MULTISPECIES: biotin--[acetyl-CoA-carboxylase] ligase [Amycolatopsis]|uniref:biotin--[biotin carboxyl-carrier protein] ligase n=2 Tax=Amycolatopsis TaxID=1813 RepID=A0A1I4BDX4_9PSEU|nr:biotin--[acetyl-CoA-carboxylase] ligase [Amycolatopsis sacchari]SFK67004.1 BirA family transcriptional regulator, biotin operon repressor / biotin-[acetyl-CoA-carboxylase] ligase [Amycolatopsis sacchari]